MWIHGATEPLLCIDFPIMLRNLANDWFNRFLYGFISSFKNLTNAFCNQFVVSKKRKKNLVCLLSITQNTCKKLRKFIQHFNTERLDVGDCNDDLDVANVWLPCWERDFSITWSWDHLKYVINQWWFRCCNDKKESNFPPTIEHYPRRTM